MTYPSRCGAAARMRAALRAYLDEQAVDAEVVSQIVLAADEAFVNSLAHGDDGVIRVSARVPDGEASVEARDRGGGFTLQRRRHGAVPDVRRVHGRGVFPIGSLMDQVSIQSARGGTTVRMVKSLPERSVRAS